MQTFGGFAYAEEYDIERKFRETRLYRTAPISTNLILAFLGQHVLGSRPFRGRRRVEPRAQRGARRHGEQLGRLIGAVATTVHMCDLRASSGKYSAQWFSSVQRA